MTRNIVRVGASRSYLPPRTPNIGTLYPPCTLGEFHRVQRTFGRIAAAARR